MRKYIHGILIGVIGAALLAACAGPPQAESPTSAPAPTAPAAPTSAPTPTAPAAPTSAPAPTVAGTPTEADIKAGIQQTLDLYAQAYNENNPELLKQAVDQTNAPFRRLVQQRFENYQQSVVAGGTSKYEVLNIKPRDLGFVQAEVQSAGGRAYDWLFRQVDGKWVLSEPTESQIGKQKKIETDHFTFYTYPWADDVNGELASLMENARSRVLEKLGKAPDKKVKVYIRPIFGIGVQTPNALAYYDKQRAGAERMVIFAPHSYAFGSYNPDTGWQGDLETTLTHEFTHLVNDNGLTPTPMSKMSDWMFEGLAVYVSDDTDYDPAVRAAVQADHIIPIVDTSNPAHPQDLEHLSLLEKDRALAYGFGKSLIVYMAEKYGGLDAFWKFTQAYSTEQKIPPALEKAFGVTYDQFDKDWRAWLKEKYS